MRKRSRFSFRYAALFSLVLVTVVAFGRSLSHQFVWDDQPIITENVHLRSIDHIPSFFTPYYWKYNHPGTKGQYRPLRTVSFALSYHLWKFQPFGYHLTNLIFHVLNVLLVYLVVIGLLKKPGTAFLAALLFALHPIHVESVSWVKNRTDLFTLFFFLLSLLCYMKYLPGGHQVNGKARQPQWITLSCLCFLLSLMSKEIAVTMPAVLALYIFYFCPSPKQRAAYTSLLPFLGIAGFYLFFIFILINKGLPPDPDAIRLNTDIHIFLIIQTISSYISLIFLPIQLNAERLMDIPIFFLNGPLLFSVSLIALIGALFVKHLLPPRKEGFAIAWFFVTLLPVININFMSGRPLAEQRLYIPSVGFCLLAALLITRYFPPKSEKRSLLPSGSGMFVAGAILGCYLILTVERDKVWHSNFTLWKDTVVKSAETYRSHFNMGSAFNERGEYEKAIAEFKQAIELNPRDHESYTSLGATYYRQGDMEQAEEMFLKASSMHPGAFRARNNLGNVYSVRGETDRALQAYGEAIKIKPDFSEAYYNRGNAYKDTGQIERAIADFQKAIEFEPDFAMSHYHLGDCYAITGETVKAQASFETAIRFDPTLINARYNLANLYYHQKLYPQAIEQLRSVLSIEPGHVESHYVLGSILVEKEKLDEAIQEYEEVVRIAPDHAEARNALGKLHVQKGAMAKGESEFKKALALDPGDGYVHYNLGRLYVTQGNYQEAQKEFEEALKLDPAIAEAWFNLGVLFHQEGEEQAALEAFKKAADVNPDYFEAQFQLGNLYLKQSQFNQAVARFKEALRISPADADTHLKLGITYLYHLNDGSNARLHLGKVIELDPNHAHASEIREAIAILE